MNVQIRSNTVIQGFRNSNSGATTKGIHKCGFVAFLLFHLLFPRIQSFLAQFLSGCASFQFHRSSFYYIETSNKAKSIQRVCHRRFSSVIAITSFSYFYCNFFSFMYLVPLLVWFYHSTVSLSHCHLCESFSNSFETDDDRHWKKKLLFKNVCDAYFKPIVSTRTGCFLSFYLFRSFFYYLPSLLHCNRHFT